MAAAAGRDRLKRWFFRRSPGSSDTDRGHDAWIADIHGGSRDELADLTWLASAEGTGRRSDKFLAAPSSPPANAAIIDDLMDALVAQAEGFGNFAHRCTGQVHAADRATVFRLGDPELIFELSNPVGRDSGLSQQVLINRHLSIIGRHEGSRHCGIDNGGRLGFRRWWIQSRPGESSLAPRPSNEVGPGR